jgi:hypothetical protein
MNAPFGREKWSMADKLNIMTFLHQVQGLVAIAERCPQPRLLARALLRARAASEPEQRRLTIPIDVQNLPDNPSPVFITYAKRTTPPPALPS